MAYQDDFRNKVVSQAKKNLSKKNSSGNLQRTISSDLKVGPNSFELSFDLGNFLVPLKHICSIKCDAPRRPSDSCTEPILQKAYILVIGKSLVDFSYINLNPFGNTIVIGLIYYTMSIING
jgi:hypothetical protein